MSTETCPAARPLCLCGRRDCPAFREHIAQYARRRLWWGRRR